VGPAKEVILRVVFDTTTVVSALLFPQGRLTWLRGHWRERRCVPLISHATTAEITRVLGYPKFQLTFHEQRELLADYLLSCEVIEATTPCPVRSRDRKDQPFLDLAYTGRSDVLVSGDQDLLVLAGKTSFRIESPEAYRQTHNAR